MVCVRFQNGEPHALLIRRGQAPRAGEWSIPGGRIKSGESEREAALRELREETGVEATLADKLCTLEPDFEGKPYRLHDWRADWVSGEPVAGDDAAEARFVDAREAATLGMWPKTLEVVLDALQRASAALDD